MMETTETSHATRPTRKPKARFADMNDRAAVLRFNERLAAGQISFRLPADGRLLGELKYRPEGHPVYRKLMVLDDGEEIRAGLLQYHSVFWVGGGEKSFCWLQLPLSEGLVNHRYSLAIVMLVKEALKRQPLQMSLGVGSLEESWAQMMLRLGWKAERVPFFFLPINVPKVLRGLTYLDKKPKLRRAAKFLAASGAGTLLGAYYALRRRSAEAACRYQIREESGFGPWADRIYEDIRGEYGAVATRDSDTMNILYPQDDPRYIRLRVQRKDGRDLGWILVIYAHMEKDSYFGNLHVGTLVDGFGRPEDVPSLIQAGMSYLADKRVDLIVANWSHAAWVSASRSNGFLSGPSNFFFFISPAGDPLLRSACPIGAIHLTRGDNDGPGKLLPRRV